MRGKGCQWSHVLAVSRRQNSLSVVLLLLTLDKAAYKRSETYVLAAAAVAAQDIEQVSRR